MKSMVYTTAQTWQDLLNSEDWNGLNIYGGQAAQEEREKLVRKRYMGAV
jgi:hypothetical protein